MTYQNDKNSNQRSDRRDDIRKLDYRWRRCTRYRHCGLRLHKYGETR